MLTSAREQYADHQLITAAAVSESRKAAPSGSVATAAVVARFQYEAAATTFAATPSILAEQSLAAPPSGTASISSVLTAGEVVAALLESIATDAAFDRLIQTLVQDAGRTAAAVDIARRPAITGYVRSLNLPSCSRCAILAGRVYRYSEGFQRHPECDCLMTPTTLELGAELVLDPTDAIERGLVKGLSKADLEALSMGADLGKVVNVRRRQAGLTIGSSVLTRGGRLTPQGILQRATSRDDAVRLLRVHGYIT